MRLLEPRIINYLTLSEAVRPVEAAAVGMSAPIGRQFSPFFEFI